MKKLITTALATGLIINSFTAFADANTPTRFEYAKELIQQSGIELGHTPKSNATEDDDYLYTALQKGLFKGISFDFDGEITEAEKEIMLESAKNLVDVPQITDGDQVTEESVENSNVTGDTSQADDTFQREYAKKYADLTIDESLIWSNEEFESYMAERFNDYSWPGEKYYYYGATFEDEKTLFTDIYTDAKWYTMSFAGYEWISPRTYEVARKLMWYAMENDDYLTVTSTIGTVEERGVAIGYAGCESQADGDDMVVLFINNYTQENTGGFEYDSYWILRDFVDGRDYTYKDYQNYDDGKISPVSEIDEYHSLIPRYYKAFKLFAETIYPDKKQGQAFFDYHTQLSIEKQGGPLFDPFTVEVGGIKYYVSYRNGNLVYYFNMPK